MGSLFFAHNKPQDVDIVYLGDEDGLNDSNDPISLSLNIPANTTFVVVGITGDRADEPVSIGGSPLISTVRLGNYAEILYLNNPPTGSQTISAQNTAGTYGRIQITYFQASKELTLSSTNSNSGISANVSCQLTLPVKRSNLVYNCIHYGSYLSNKLLHVSNSDTSVFFGLNDASFGSSNQYSISNDMGIIKDSTWMIQNDMNWRSVVACFSH